MGVLLAGHLLSAQFPYVSPSCAGDYRGHCVLGDCILRGHHCSLYKFRERQKVVKGNNPSSDNTFSNLII